MLRTCVHRGAAGGLAAVVGLAGLAVLGGSARAAAPVSPARAGTVATWGPGVSAEMTGGAAIPPPTFPGEEAGTAFVKALSNGPDTLLALSADGRVVRAGTSVFGTTLPASLSGTVVKDIAADHIEGGAAVTQDGHLITWGPGFEKFVTALPSGLPDLKAISIEPENGNYAAAITSTGGVVAWGDAGAEGQLDVPSGLTGVTQVAVSTDNMYALKSDGTVVAWGSDVYGEVTNLPAVLTDSSDNVDVTDVVANGASAVALLSDGSLVAWGKYTSAGTSGTLNAVPASLSGKTVVALGGDGSTRYEAIDSDGHAYMWGEDTAPAAAWTQLPSDVDASKITSLSLNDFFATALVTKVLAISKPSISGTPKVGQTLTATPSTFSGGVTSDQVSGQWFAGEQAINGATGTTYVPTTADVGKTLFYRSTATTSGGTVTSDSAPTAAVAAAGTVTQQPPAGGNAATPPTAAQQKLAKDQNKLQKTHKKLKKAKKAHNATKAAKLKKKLKKLKKAVKKDKKLVAADE